MATPTAIVIEDQPNLVLLYEDALRLVGYNVVSIKNGLDAINQLEMLSSPPAIIFLDVNLPRLSGRDVLKHIRRRETLAQVPVIVMTANTLMANEMQPLLRDNDQLLVKPVSVATLQSIAKQHRPQEDTPDYMAETQETRAVRADAASTDDEEDTQPERPHNAPETTKHDG